MASHSVTINGTAGELNEANDAFAWKHNYDTRKLVNETKAQFFDRMILELVKNAVKERRRFDLLATAEAAVTSPNIT